MSIRKLSDGQVEDFDTEYVKDELKPIYQRHCDERFRADESFHILDVGGGTGRFMDYMLDIYPNATGIVLDNSATLLERNKQHPRKQVVSGSAEELDSLFPNEQFDLISMHWVLHHFVIGNYQATTDMVQRVLRAATNQLSADGRISVFENMYDGWLFRDLPGHVIYTLTSAAWLGPVTRKFGANTGGIGVCLSSQREWSSMLDSCGLDQVSYSDGLQFRKSLMRRYVLHMGNVRSGHFWVRKSR